MISTLIDKQDTVEIVRDQVAAILAQEVASQKALAEKAGQQASDYDFRVYLERSNPWSDFLDANGEVPPVLNVTLESADYQMAQSTIVGDFVKTSALYNIDCYGFGIGTDDPSEPGHRAADKMGATEAHRAARFVRNVLMSAEYIYLGLRQDARAKWVHSRWVESLSIFVPPIEQVSVQQVVAARLALRVMFNESAPQHEGCPIEGVYAGLIRKETGEVYVALEYQ
jgi:hypothetical protein